MIIIKSVSSIQRGSRVTPSPLLNERTWVLTIYKNHPVGSFRHKH